MEHRSPSYPRWAAVRDDLRTRRACRASRRTLERELASYTTPADLLELDAILDRAEPAAADDLRRFMHHSRVA